MEGAAARDRPQHAGAGLRLASRADSNFLRARIDMRVGTPFTQLENMPSGFSKLLERCFCVFVKIIRISSGFEELLEMFQKKLQNF